MSSSLVGALASALRRRSGSHDDDARAFIDDNDAAAALEREVEALTAQALARLKKEQQQKSTPAPLPPPPQPSLPLLLPRRAPPPGPTPGSLADLVDQAARAAQADAARSSAEAAAQSGEDLRWALERHSLPAASGAAGAPGQGEDAADDASAALAAAAPAMTITYAGFCAALAECPAAAAAAGVEAPLPYPLPQSQQQQQQLLLPDPLPAAALFLRVERAAAPTAATAAAPEEQEETAPTDVLADLLARRAAARQVRAELAAYDPQGTGWLSGAAVERWLADTAPLLPPLDEEKEDGNDGNGVASSTILPDELYARVAARKVFLFHGQRRRRRRIGGGFSDGGASGAAGGFDTARPSTCSDAALSVVSATSGAQQQQLWVSAAELAASSLALELLEARAWRGRLTALARWEGTEEEEYAGQQGDDDRLARQAAAQDALVGNWFSRQSARRALATFAAWRCSVDGGGGGDNNESFPPDGHGALTLAQFSRIGGGGMSPLFLARVFECAVSGSLAGGDRASSGGGGGGGGGGAAAPRLMVLPDFCDFVLAWDNRHRSPQALSYLFPLLDLRGRGELSPADLYAHFREVRALAGGGGAEEGEGGGNGGGEDDDGSGVPSVRDVVAEIRDMVPGPITREGLWRSGLAGVIVGMLTSVDEFWAWNNREGSGG